MRGMGSFRVNRASRSKLNRVQVGRLNNQISRSKLNRVKMGRENRVFTDQTSDKQPLIKYNDSDIGAQLVEEERDDGRTKLKLLIFLLFVLLIRAKYEKRALTKESGSD